MLPLLYELILQFLKFNIIYWFFLLNFPQLLVLLQHIIHILITIDFFNELPNSSFGSINDTKCAISLLEETLQ